MDPIREEGVGVHENSPSLSDSAQKTTRIQSLADKLHLDQLIGHPPPPSPSHNAPPPPPPRSASSLTSPRASISFNEPTSPPREPPILSPRNRPTSPPRVDNADLAPLSPPQPPPRRKRADCLSSPTESPRSTSHSPRTANPFTKSVEVPHVTTLLHFAGQTLSSSSSSSSSSLLSSSPPSSPSATVSTPSNTESPGASESRKESPEPHSQFKHVSATFASPPVPSRANHRPPSSPSAPSSSISHYVVSSASIVPHPPARSSVSLSTSTSSSIVSPPSPSKTLTFTTAVLAPDSPPQTPTSPLTPPRKSASGPSSPVVSPRRVVQPTSPAPPVPSRKRSSSSLPSGAVEAFVLNAPQMVRNPSDQALSPRGAPPPHSIMEDEEMKMMKVFMNALEMGNALQAIEMIPKLKDYLDYQTSNGTSPLHLATLSDNIDLVRLILSYAPSIDLVDHSKWTALHYACSAGNLKIVDMLLDKEASVDIPSKDGNLAFHYLARLSSASCDEFHFVHILKRMLERGLDINFQNKQGESALHNAAFTGNTHIINALIDKGANPNLLNHTGDTPLHYSVRRGDPSIVSLLISKGADPDIVGMEGNAIQLAVKDSQHEVMALLFSTNSFSTSKSNSKEQYQGQMRAVLMGSIAKFSSHLDLTKAASSSSIEPKNRDKYGFPVDPKHLPLYEAFSAKYAREIVERKKGWAKFFSTSDLSSSISGNSPVFRKLVRDGIPMEHRSEVWFKIASERVNIPCLDQTYRALIAEPSSCTIEIEKDIPRTFPEHLFFQSNAGKDSLRRVLHAYANRNPVVGYCQSMNYLAGLLLLIMSEEKAFVVLSYIIETLMQDYYIRSLSGLLLDQRILCNLLLRKMPRINRTFQEHCFPLEVCATRWLMCIFLNSAPIETIMRIWDCFLLDGVEVLFAVILTLLKERENEIVVCTSINALMDSLNDYLNEMFDADILIKSSMKMAPSLFDGTKIEAIRLDPYWNQNDPEEEQKRSKHKRIHRVITHVFSKREEE